VAIVSHLQLTTDPPQLRKKKEEKKKTRKINGFGVVEMSEHGASEGCNNEGMTERQGRQKTFLHLGNDGG